MVEVIKFVAAVFVIAVMGYSVGWVAKDSADRLNEHDRHYCTDIEGHTVAECEKAGR